MAAAQDAKDKLSVKFNEETTKDDSPSPKPSPAKTPVKFAPPKSPTTGSSSNGKNGQKQGPLSLPSNNAMANSPTASGPEPTSPLKTPPAATLNKPSLVKGKGFSKLSKLKGKPLLQKFKKMAGKVSQGHEFFRRTSVTLVCNDSSSSEESDEEDVAFDAKSIMAQPDLPPDFWQVQKLIRYLKIGNQTATIIALCNLVDFPLRKEYVQVAIMDSGGLEVLTNLLDTDDHKCRIGSLKILREITINAEIRKQITLMGGVEPTIAILSEPYPDQQLIATETLANLTQFRRARNIFRRHGGIPILVDLLDVDMKKFGDIEKMSLEDLPLPLKVARGSSYALWSLAKSTKNKSWIKRSGGLSLLSRLVRSKHTGIVIPAIGTLQECATDKSYCLAMQNEGLMEDLVRHLNTQSEQLKMLCANAIFRLAEEKESRHLVKLHGGLEPLVDLINDSENSSNKKLLAAVTGALWKVSSDSDNVERLIDLGIVPTLIRLLLENSDALDDLQFNPLKISVLTNVVGALAECAKQQDNRDLIKNEDGLAPLIKLIGTNHPELLVNVSAALGECAKDKDSLKIIHKIDGVRLVWSLLKHPNERVQASAAWALSPCISNAANAGDMVRSFVGGLELICGLLESEETEVQAAVCYAIANIARDKENLAVITDHGVIEKLAKLADTEDDTLRAKLAEAIANCCEWPGNRALFGQSGAVAPLVSYLASNDLEVHRTTSVALFQLSKDPWNCVTMHQHGVVGHLLRLIGSEDESVQEASADCLQNIRKLALACEKFRYQHMKS